MRITFGLAILVSLAMPGSVAAYQLAPQVEAELDRIVELNYRGSPQASPPPCTQVCQELRAAETRAGGWSTPQAEQLARESRTLRVRTKLMRAIRMSGAIALGPTAFELGFLMGSGLNAKFFKVGIPAKAADMTGAPQQLSYYSSCSTANPCRVGSPYHDRAELTEPAYVWQWKVGLNNWWTWRSSETDCLHPTPPTEAPNLYETTTSSDTCTGPASGTNTSAWWYANEFRATTPLQDYVGQPYDDDATAPPDPGFATTRTATRAELESGRYPLLNDKLEHELGLPEKCDPVDPDVCNPPETDRTQERKCDLSSPVGADPDPTVSTDQFAPAQYATVTPFTRTPLGGGTPVPTAIKVGWTAPSSKREWKGWGWRHVAAKHGWSAADIASTQVALLNPPVDENGGLEYVGPEYEQNGVLCQRRVVVNPSTTDPIEPASKEIITSYAEHIGPADD